MRRVCVYCGSSSGSRPVYAEAAGALGSALVARNLGLVYGGASVGLMGTLATAVLGHGGDVVGVIPRALVEREIAYERLPELRVVETMHERKALMSELADGFVALPGGMGTIDELAEAITWAQLGMHEKPIGLLDVDGYFDSLLAFADHAVAEGFVRPADRASLLIDSEPGRLLDLLADHEPPSPKWRSGEPPAP